MKSRRFYWLIAVSCLFAMTVSAADIDGKWTAQVPGRGGETRETTFTFKADGDKLTGTMSGARGEREISEGKVAGDNISFAIVFGEFRIEYKGKVAGNQIKFTVERPGGAGTFEFTAKKI